MIQSHDQNAEQMLGGGEDMSTHTIQVLDNTHSKKFNTHVSNYKVTLKNIDGKTYQEICHNFDKIMKDVIQSVLRPAKPDDMIRFHISSRKFNGDHINTKFQPRSQIAPDYITAIIDKTMQSNNTIDMSDDFEINVMHVRIPTGSGTKRMIDPNMIMNLIRKKCALTGMRDWFTDENRDPQIHCFAYALAIAKKLKTECYKNVRIWSRCRTRVRGEVMKLHREAGVPAGPVAVHQYPAFQHQLPENQRLVVVDALYSKGVLYKGDTNGQDLVCLLYYNGHYIPLKNLSTWFAQAYYCVECESGTNSANHHVCPKDRVCHRCGGKRCLSLPKLHRYCKTCHGMFCNPECLIDHSENGVCRTATTCEHCGAWFPNADRTTHTCNGLSCTFCRKSHETGEGCFITPSTHVQKKRWRYVFYDLETYQDDPLPGTNKKPHVVNYVVAMSFCSDCDAQPCEACEETHHFSGLGGGNAMYTFCFWATSDPINRHSVFIAHNAKSFDAHFVLDYLVTEGNTPELVMQGGKILKIRVASTDVTFIDSLSFISMPLADFSKTFDLPDTVKGCFPHLFNHPDNYTYDGMLPTLNYYDPDGMKEKSREKLLQWHAEHKFDNFVFSEELKNYCVDDVALLKAGCMKFRASFLDATGVDPFNQITIASACMEVFRRNFLTANTIGEC